MQKFAGRTARSEALGRIGRRSPDPLANPKPLIRRVYSYVAYWIGEAQGAEDVTSTIFERAVQCRSCFDGTRDDPSAWLFRIARSAVAERVGQAVSAPVPKENRGDVGGVLEAKASDRLTLEDALAALTHADRDLVSLRYGAGLTTREIAAVLDVERNAAEVALGRACGRLRRILPEANG